MNDAAEVLSAIYESLERVAGGATLVRELFEWQVGAPPTPFPAPSLAFSRHCIRRLQEGFEPATNAQLQCHPWLLRVSLSCLFFLRVLLRYLYYSSQ